MTRRWASQAQLNFTGEGQAKFKRLPGIVERDISRPVKKLLAMHPAVALAARINTGAGYLVPYQMMQDIMAEMGGERVFEARFGKRRWMEFGSPGCSDYLGIMKDGRMLALEVKGSKYVPSQVTAEQRSFLHVIMECGGVAFVGSDLARINAVLGGAKLEDSGHGYLV